MSYQTYILWSETLQKFYVGSTEDLRARLERHNSARVKFTSKGLPWRLIWHKQANDRKEAYNLEMRIKARGAKRYLEDNNIPVGT